MRGEWVKRHKCVGGFRRVKGVDDMGEQREITVDERCEYDDFIVRNAVSKARTTF